MSTVAKKPKQTNPRIPLNVVCNRYHGIGI
jgi:hypothetical protein